MYMYEPPPPFIGTWEQMRSNTIGMVKKTTTTTTKTRTSKRSTTRSKFALQKHASIKPHIVILKFHKNIPMSNYDRLEWCRYLNEKDVLSRDETVPHNNRKTLFLYSLEPRYMSGSYWVGKCKKWCHQLF